MILAFFLAHASPTRRSISCPVESLPLPLPLPLPSPHSRLRPSGIRVSDASSPPRVSVLFLHRQSISHYLFPLSLVTSSNHSPPESVFYHLTSPSPESYKLLLICDLFELSLSTYSSPIVYLCFCHLGFSSVLPSCWTVQTKVELHHVVCFPILTRPTWRVDICVFSRRPNDPSHQPAP